MKESTKLLKMSSTMNMIYLLAFLSANLCMPLLTKQKVCESISRSIFPGICSNAKDLLPDYLCIVAS